MERSVLYYGKRVNFDISYELDKFRKYTIVNIVCKESPNFNHKIVYGGIADTKTLEDHIQNECELMAESYFKQEKEKSKLAQTKTYNLY